MSGTSETVVREAIRSISSHPAFSLSTHRPWQSHPTRWPQLEAHTPISRSTLQAPGPCVAWGSLVQAASHPGCSVAHSRSAHHGTYTGTYSWGKRSGRSDRPSRPKRTQFPRELEENKQFGLFKEENFIIYPTHDVLDEMCDTVTAHSPTQMPVLWCTVAVYSHCSPLRVSQGFISEHICPFWRAQTRQQTQSSRTRGTPGRHTGGSSGHWHLRGQNWDQANVNTCVRKMTQCFYVALKSPFLKLVSSVILCNWT